MEAAPRTGWSLRRVVIIALCLLPTVPLGLTVWANHLPAQWNDQVLNLAGEWKGSDTVGAQAAAPEFDDRDLRSVHLPGSLTEQGLSGTQVWLRRSVELPQALRGQELLLVLGETRGAPVSLFINGTLVGSKGVPASGFIGSDGHQDAFVVPPGLVTGPRAVVAFALWAPAPGYNGIADERILLGPQPLVAPWFFNLVAVRGLLEYGTLLLLGFLGGLVLVLRLLEGGRADKSLYRGTLLLIAAGGVYLTTKSGLVASMVLAPRSLQVAIIASVLMLGLAVPEFFEGYYLGRVSWFRNLSRAVSALALLALLTPLDGDLVYRLYANWLFLAMLHALGLAGRDLLKRGKSFGPLVASAALFATLSAVNDLLTDLDVWYSTRLFTFAVANLAIAAAVVVVGDFIELADENTRLSASLQVRAAELGEALVRAEESSRVKSEFLANTSHELRTPLNSIINIPQGLLEQMKETRQAHCTACGAAFELEPGEPLQANSPCPDCQAPALSLKVSRATTVSAEETERLLRSVVGSASHLAAVVNDILDYSKLEAGRAVLHPEPTAVSVLFAELSAEMTPTAEQGHVKLVVEKPPASLRLVADPLKLKQALLNLVSNAIKFSDGKGTVTVRAEPTGSSLRISVSDEGIGIAPENHQLIFEGFRQVDGQHTRRFGGTGLGLAICRRMVALHGGELTVDSALGRGSTFVVTLPLSPRAPEAQTQ